MNAPFRWAGGRRGGSRQGSCDCRRSRAGVVGLAGGSLGPSRKPARHTVVPRRVAETRAAAVLAALDRPFPFPSFSLGLGGLGAFPSSGMPRVVWLGVRDGTDSIANIHGEIAARLQPLGFAAERRPFSAHLTIGRVKSARAGVQSSRYPTTVERCPGRGGRVPDSGGHALPQPAFAARGRLRAAGASDHCSDT